MTHQKNTQRILWGQISKNLCNFHTERPLRGKSFFFFFYSPLLLPWEILPFRKVPLRLKINLYGSAKWVRSESLWEITVWLSEQECIHLLSSEALGWDHSCLTPCSQGGSALGSWDAVFPKHHHSCHLHLLLLLVLLPLSPSAPSLECSPTSIYSFQPSELWASPAALDHALPGDLRPPPLSLGPCLAGQAIWYPMLQQHTLTCHLSWGTKIPAFLGLPWWLS